ncbi:hypothetical protein [uncultured Eubacterium sp.]|uniref:hypothetical protein n=1 Tax=uncultured Eubacterium sp. TaxID=165185 RepID=UPI0025E3F5C9|nr:hypothetical protein [uncultured Eubacterium sp.]
MDNNFTVTAAYIAALAAIIAPTISALIHSFKEYKIAKMSHTIDSCLKLCEAFSDSYFKCQYGIDKTGYISDFYKATSKLIIICHKRHTRRMLFQLANQVKENGASVETDKLYEKCISSLTREF